jgi:hypothetical protein
MEPGKFQLEDKENIKCQPIEIIEAYLGDKESPDKNPMGPAGGSHRQPRRQCRLSPSEVIIIK